MENPSSPSIPACLFLFYYGARKEEQHSFSFPFNARNSKPGNFQHFIVGGILTFAIFRSVTYYRG